MTASTTPASTGVTTWTIDAAHSRVEFAVKHLMISTVRGSFAGVSGAVQIDEQDWTKSTVQATIDVGTISTGQEQRDAHLRSPDFFDAEQFPTLTFVSKRVEGASTEQFKVIGDLTIHGVTREVTLDVTEEGRGGDPWGGQRIAFLAKTAIDRRDFGLTWNQALETGGLVVSNDVKITLELQVSKAA